MKKLMIIFILFSFILLTGCKPTEEENDTKNTSEWVYEPKMTAFTNDTTDSSEDIYSKLQEYYTFFTTEQTNCSPTLYDDIVDPTLKSDFQVVKPDPIMADMCRTDMFIQYIGRTIAMLDSTTAYVENDIIIDIEDEYTEYRVFIEGDTVLITILKFYDFGVDYDDGAEMMVYYLDKIDGAYYGEIHSRFYTETNNEIISYQYVFYKEDSYSGSMDYGIGGNTVLYLSDTTTNMMYRYFTSDGLPEQFEYMDYNTNTRAYQSNIQETPITGVNLYYNGRNALSYTSFSPTDATLRIDLITLDGWTSFDHITMNDILYVNLSNGTETFTVPGEKTLSLYSGGNLYTTRTFDHIPTESDIMLDNPYLTEPYDYNDFSSAIDNLETNLDTLLIDYGLGYPQSTYEEDLINDFFTNDIDIQVLIDFFNANND